jgi:glycosyltransferase involved in cell wall biosynthesis
MISEDPLDLTIAIPVLNEERNIGLCLGAIRSGLARHVVLIDSGSTDKTSEIATHHGADVVNFEWDGRFPKKRNWFLRNHTPGTSWVLFLDADEMLTPEFCSELRRTLPTTTKMGFWLSYSIHYGGAKLQGGYPLKKLALFRVGAGEYEKIEEDHWSHLDMEVHEHPVIDGPVGEIHSRIDHRESKSEEEDAARHAEYATWEASRIRASGKNATNHHWTWRQRLKNRVISSPFAGPLFFAGSFLLMGGFLDGMRGFRYARKKSAYFSLVSRLIRQAPLPEL